MHRRCFIAFILLPLAVAYSVISFPSVNIDPRQARINRRSAMADQAALITALTELAAAMANNAGGNAAAGHAPILDPLATNNPFDLGSRAGATAFTQVCAALDTKWDGTSLVFPSFLTALRIRAREAGWDKAGNTGICNIGAHNIFTHYHHLSATDTDAARVARVDPRAIQNSQAMYRTLKSSITGTLSSSIFGQFGNAPIHEDGVGLWIKLTKFTLTSSLQMSVAAFDQIIHFRPEDHDFHVPTINSKLLNLFVLATTRHRELGDPEKLQHTITVYSRIKQPPLWATWVANQTDRIEEGTVTVLQDFMNSAALKQAQITAKEDGFHASVKTLQQDIVAMLAKTKTSTPRQPKNPKQEGDATKVGKFPPFARHFRTSTEPNSPEYKIGDTKSWNGDVYYYCDCPNHRGRVRWHKHPAPECTTRKNWLNKQQSDSAPTAHLGTADTPPTEPSLASDESVSTDSDVTALLANAYSLLGSNSATQEFIADALSALTDE